MSDETRLQSFEEFWPFYVGEHAHPFNRALHFVGTSCFLATAATGVLTLNPVLVGISPLFGYGFAWVGHFFVEHNRPATFKYPLWSLKADFVMYKKILTGQMDAELARAAATRS